MAEFEDKLNAVLSNPELMGQILSMAGSLNQQPGTPPPPPPSANFGSMPFDPGAMAGMMQMLKATQLEPRQRNLVQALRGFVPEDRLVRLEKAMQASLIAKFASAAMNEGGRNV
jgi:hypothetical protein